MCASEGTALVPTHEQLEAAFGAEGSWTLSGELPSSFWTRNGESPYEVREFRSSPPLLKREMQALLQTWGAAVINSKGNKGGKEGFNFGQDNFCVSVLSSGWEVLGVFDGHGKLGHWPSERLSRTIPFFLQTNPCSELLADGRPAEALRWAIEAAEADLEDRSHRQHVSIASAGSTLVVALRDPEQEHLWVATVGDSRAVLIRARPPAADGGAKEGGGSGALGGAEVLAHTADHKPGLEEEMARIHAMGGQVLGQWYSDGSCDHRVYHRGRDQPGIALARSMGDCDVKDIGVSAEPDIVQWSLKDAGDAHLLLCSDGVWEFLSNERVANIVLHGAQEDSPEQALTDLLDESRAMWQQRSGTYCDDITMVLAPVCRGKAPRSDLLDEMSPIDDEEGIFLVVSNIVKRLSKKSGLNKQNRRRRRGRSNNSDMSAGGASPLSDAGTESSDAEESSVGSSSSDGANSDDVNESPERRRWRDLTVCYSTSDTKGAPNKDSSCSECCLQ